MWVFSKYDIYIKMTSFITLELTENKSSEVFDKNAWSTHFNVVNGSFPVYFG